MNQTLEQKLPELSLETFNQIGIRQFVRTDDVYSYVIAKEENTITVVYEFNKKILRETFYKGEFQLQTIGIECIEDPYKIKKYSEILQ